MGLMPCTILAHWIPTNMSIDPKSDNIAILDNPLPVADVVDSPSLLERAKTLDMDLSFAEALNVPLSSSEATTVMEEELIRLELNDSRFDGDWKAQWPYVAATVLSLQLADALARSNNDEEIYTLCEGCEALNTTSVDSLSSLNGEAPRHMPRSNQTNFIASVNNQPERYTPVTRKLERYGYGWALKRPTEWLAAAVLVLHALLGIVHIAVVTQRRWRCYA